MSSEYKENMSKVNKKNWSSDDYRNNMIKTFNSEKIKKIKSNTTIRNWSSDDYRNNMVNVMKNKCAEPEYRKNQLLINKRISNDKNVQQLKSKRMVEKWKDTVFAERMFKSSVKYKEVTLPSGRVVKLQGYEPQVLEQLLQTYTEEDIVCEVKSINKELGKILYNFEGKERRYYPDFYIKSTNTIIEVKSQWTFDKWKEKNLAKEQACLQQGFNFEFIVL